MTDIREVFAEWLRDGVAKILEVENPSAVVPEWDEMSEFLKDAYQSAARQGLTRLHENGVVRKVEGELPKNIVELAALSTSGKLAVVEPLIKEEGNER